MKVKESASIQDWIKWLEADKNIKIMFAVEAGSRAWNVASPDSDYDIRFIYVHPRNAYLGINRPKDSVEVSVGDLDFQGWDITKACHLAHKSNPALLEWLTTDQIYVEKATTAAKLRRATKDFSAKALMHHYTSLAVHTWKTYLEDPDKPLLKKYLYAVRPTLCLLYMRQHGYKFPPMDFNVLANSVVAEGFTESETKWIDDDLENLLELKRTAGEMDGRARYPWLDELIGKVVIECGRTWATEAPNSVPDYDTLDVLCQDTINGFNCTP